MQWEPRAEDLPLIKLVTSDKISDKKVRDNPSVELLRVPSPAAGPGSANAEDIQRALSQCQARSSYDKGRFVLQPLHLPAHGKLQKFPC